MSRQREIAYQILCEAFRGEKFANLAMQRDLQELPEQQRPFVTDLVNGVLRRFLWLRYQFTQHLRKETRLELQVILAMAFYERIYRKEKNYALVNEYVNLASDKEKGFVNAVLRKENPILEPKGMNVETLSIRYSLPVWIVKMFQKQYESDDFMYLLEDAQKEASVIYRRAPLRASKEEIERKYCVIFDDDYAFTSEKNLLNTVDFKTGKFYVQDRNAMKIVSMLDLKHNSMFLDLCSAPGTKLYNALEIVKEENVYSNDVNSIREELVKKRAVQLGYEKVNYSSEDGRLLAKKYPQKFDRILLDVPCSGLGVLKRKPDLRYRLRPENLDVLQELQKELLEAAVEMLQEGGVLVYSTCTLNRKENDKQIKTFLENYPNFQLIEEKLFIREEGDHFYAAKLMKGAY